MKILFVDQFSEFGGAQICLRDLLDETVRRGWRSIVMAPGNGPLHTACADRGIPSFPLPLARNANGHKTIPDVLRYGFGSLRSGLAIREAAQRFSADLIYVNGPRALPAAVLAVRSENTPVIFHAHSYADRGYARRIARWCVSRKQMSVVGISRFVARPFAQLSAGPKPRIVYNGVPDHGFFARPRPKPSTVGIIGRISPEKGHLDFVRAAKTMIAARPCVRFLVFGGPLFADDSYEREVRSAAEGLPVDFRGWTNDVSAALREIDILTVPSGPAEGATRVIMEAFSAGTPVAAYPSGGIPELVRHRETGLLTERRESGLLAQALLELIDHPVLMSHLSAAGRREWEARFQLGRWQRDLCDFIEETVRSPLTACANAPASTNEIRFESEAAEPEGGAKHAAL